MTLSTIVITALGIIIIVLQLITISKITKKSTISAVKTQNPQNAQTSQNNQQSQNQHNYNKSENRPKYQGEQKPGSRNQNQRFDKDRRDNRQNFQKQHQQKGQSSSPSGAQTSVSPIDKSLLEINLRLKNAEKKQEIERKRHNENRSKDGENRFDRSRFNQNKNSYHQNNRPAATVEDKEFSREKSDLPAPEAKIETPLVVKEQILTQQNNPAPADQENEFGRGGKVTLKRRSLSSGSNDETTEKSDITDSNKTTEAQSQPVFTSTLNNGKSDVQTEKIDESVSFGRR